MSNTNGRLERIEERLAQQQRSREIWVKQEEHPWRNMRSGETRDDPPASSPDVQVTRIVVEYEV